MKRDTNKVKNILILLIVFLFGTVDTLLLKAQNVSINPSGNTPNSAAILDISASDKGILIPRMTDVQRQALKDPATGLIIYNTTSNNINYYNGSGWQNILNNNVSSTSGSGTASGSNVSINTSGNNADPSAILDISSTNTGLLIPRTTQGAVTNLEGLLIYNTSSNTVDYYNGSSWNSLCNNSLDNIFGTGATVNGIAINNSGASADPSAILDISSTTKGVLIPRMTSTQRNAIKTPATGLILFNSTSKRLESWNGSAWYEMQNDSDAPSAPITSSHTTSTTQIIWNWNTSTGASGYKYNTVNDYATATDNGTATSYTQTGLSCGTAYTLYVWAYNDCGNSTNLTINESTDACATYPIGTVHCLAGGAVIQDVTNPSTGKTWMDRNLGASRVATSKTDALAYGDYYQWGRFSDGHQCSSSPTTSTNSSSDTPGHGNFIIETSDAPHFNWRSPNNYTLWQGVSGTNNPCPNGYRIPTSSELDNERASWPSNNPDGAFASPLKLTIAGYRDRNSTLFGQGSFGYYWSSSVPSLPQLLYFPTGSSAIMGNGYGAFGNSIRCIKN